MLSVELSENITSPPVKLPFSILFVLSCSVIFKEVLSQLLNVFVFMLKLPML